jgi:hypothetical protein
VSPEPVPVSDRLTGRPSARVVNNPAITSLIDSVGRQRRKHLIHAHVASVLHQISPGFSD